MADPWQPPIDMAPPNPSPRSLAALTEVLVEEILLRIRPDEPADLFRAALVCKPWRRIISDAGFVRRYRTLHPAPPLLGYFHNFYPISTRPIPIAEFIRTTTTAHPPLFPLRAAPDCRNLCVHDCRHGRVLYQDNSQLIVWDPITDDQKKLSMPDHPYAYRTVAVLCAVDGCDHLDCHAGPFLVVFRGTSTFFHNPSQNWATIYSSETQVWSTLTSIDTNIHYVAAALTLLIGNALYFSLEWGVGMLKYDLGRHELSVIPSPSGIGRAVVAMELDDGGLGFVVAALDNCMYVWSWKADANNGIGSWAQHMVLTALELKALLPRGRRHLTGWVEGTHTIFISVVDAGVFTLDLKSKKAKKVGKIPAYSQIKPYMAFYTPGLAKGRQTQQ